MKFSSTNITTGLFTLSVGTITGKFGTKMLALFNVFKGVDIAGASNSSHSSDFQIYLHRKRIYRDQVARGRVGLRFTFDVADVLLHVHVDVLAVLVRGLLFPFVDVVRVVLGTRRAGFVTGVAGLGLFLLLHAFVLRSPVLEPNLHLKQERRDR